MSVARVLDAHTVVVTGGTDIGVTAGEVLQIREDIIDPETGEKIGVYPDLKVRVTDVHPRFCVAETFCQPQGRNDVTITINIGDAVQRERCG